jgi:hypothetical protein
MQLWHVLMVAPYGISKIRYGEEVRKVEMMMVVVLLLLVLLVLLVLMMMMMMVMMMKMMMMMMMIAVVNTHLLLRRTSHSELWLKETGYYMLQQEQVNLDVVQCDWRASEEGELVMKRARDSLLSHVELT